MENNNSKVWIIIVAVIIILVGVYFAVRQNKKKSPVSTPAPISQQNSNQSAVSSQSGQGMAAKSITLNLAAQNNSLESGTAVLTEDNGKTKVTLNMVGFPQNVPQPSHIHTGSCANAGAVKYSLNPVVNGKAETIVDASLDSLLASPPLYVNVHKSTAEIGVFYSCADITAGGNKAVQSPTSSTINSSSQTVEDRSASGGTFSTPTDNRKGADKPED